MGRRAICQELLAALKPAGIEVVSLEEAARELLARRDRIPTCMLGQETIEGRSGLVATQGVAG